MWYFLMLATGLVLTFMWHIGNLEKIRQQELMTINKQLEQHIAEMERFTYAASHDLKSPVVTIKGFLGVLRKDIQENSQERIEVDFKRISDAADKMGALLSELVELSRIGRIINPPEEIDLAKVVNEAIELLNAHIHATNTIIQISSKLPIVYGERIRLREVFENLIENAIKYKNTECDLVLEIGQLNRDAEVILFVRDNGIGIEHQYHTKIFGLFEKLNPLAEGTGIGLAVTKRIIEVHGGRIWVESEGLGKGSTFCFTIPSAEISNNKG